MTTYFKPFRRKLGVLTLVMACVLMAGWVRSQSFNDMYFSGSGRGLVNCQFGSHKNGMLWMRDSAEKPMQWSPGLLTTNVLEGDTDDPLGDLFYSYETAWRWRWNGIDAGEIFDKETHTVRTGWIKIPYWSIVIPLTLLSAWLLLSKPRAKSDI